MLFTTACHPQIIGQTETIMPILFTTLSMYVTKFHSNWSILLPMVTFAYNTTSQSSIKMIRQEMKTYENESDTFLNTNPEIVLERHS